MKITNSLLNTADTCQRKAAFKYIAGIDSTEKHEALNIGSAFHYAMQFYNGVDGLEEIVSSMDSKFFMEDELLNPEEKKDKIQNLAKLCAMTIATTRYMSGALGIDLSLVKREVVVDTEIKNDKNYFDLNYNAVLDGVEITKSGSMIIEYKTTSRIDQTYLDKFKFNSQVVRYYKSYKLSHPDETINGVMIVVALKSLKRIKKGQTPEDFANEMIAEYSDPEKNMIQSVYISAKEIEATSEYKNCEKFMIHQAYRYYEAISLCEDLQIDIDKYGDAIPIRLRARKICESVAGNTSQCDGIFKCKYFNICKSGGDILSENEYRISEIFEELDKGV